MRAWWIVFVFVLLVACAPAAERTVSAPAPIETTTPAPTATSIPSPSVTTTPRITSAPPEEEPGLAESEGEICGGSGRVLAWIDENANGVREDGERPLSDVHFFVGPGLYRGLLHDAWSDHQGEALLDLPGPPPGPSNPDCSLPFPGLVVQAETPSGYRLTTDDQIRVEDFDEERTYAFGFVYDPALPSPAPDGTNTPLPEGSP